MRVPAAGLPRVRTAKPPHAGGPISTLVAPKPRSAFMRDGRGTTFGRWFPALRSSQEDVASAWQAAAARTTETIQNSGWIAGMIDQATANTVALGLRLHAMPENDLFGMNEKAAQDWRKLVEARWSLWANNPLECDIEGTRTVAQMQEAVFKQWIATGEVWGEIVNRVRPESSSRTKVRLLPATRVINRTDPFRRIFSGVRVNADGLPVAYLARSDDPLLGEREHEVAARDPWGRPKVVHVFAGLPGQRRGISVLVPVLKVAKQFDQLSDATLMASLIQTVFAASIQSDLPTEETLRSLLSPGEQAKLMSSGGTPFDAWFEAQSGWAEGHPIDVGFAGRFAHLFPGEKLEFHTPTQPQAAYKEFSLHLLREMARCLGMTFESATGDYTGATYSSVRAATTEVFAITQSRRAFILAPFCQPIYAAWLEEEIFKGSIPFPGGPDAFLQNRAAATRAGWAGAPKPVADDLKAAKSAEVYQGMGVISDQMIANDLGVDIEDVYAQRARERALRKQYGLPENKTVATLEANKEAKTASAKSEEPDVDDDPDAGE